MKSNDSEPKQHASSLPTLTSRTELDAHGHNPADYKWVPVLRRPRSDGWTPQRQVDFIAALADTGCVEQAAREVGMSAYTLRHRKPLFSEAPEASFRKTRGTVNFVNFRAENHRDARPSGGLAALPIPHGPSTEALGRNPIAQGWCVAAAVHVSANIVNIRTRLRGRNNLTFPRFLLLQEEKS